jgi:hypothetical protein
MTTNLHGRGILLAWLGSSAPLLAAPAEPSPVPVTTESTAPEPIPDERPEYLPYAPHDPVPPGYRVQRYYPRGFLIAGSITFGVGYGLGLLAVASTSSDKDFNAYWLILPVTGPFIGMATQRDTCTFDTTPTNCGRDTGTLVVLAVLGSLQVVGATLFTVGLTQRRERLVRVDGPQMTLAPVPMGRAGYGLAATGTF